MSIDVKKLKNTYNNFEEITNKINEIIDVAGGGGGSGFEPTQQQLDAMNSGATANKINKIATNETNISSLQTNKLDKLTDAGEFIYSHEGPIQNSKGFEVSDEPSGSAAHVASSKTVKAVKTALTTEINKKVDKLATPVSTEGNNRIYQCKLNEQGQVISISNEFNWSNTFNTDADNQLFTRKGAYNLYTNYLKSTNGTLTKGTAITSDYSHYIKCGNIYQLSIGFQNSAQIEKDTILYTLPETLSNASIEMYVVISSISGDNRVLQCGGNFGGNKLCSKGIIPAGYWFGSAILIKV